MSGIAGSVKKFTMNGPVECSWHGSLIKFKRGRAQSSQQRAVKGDTNRAKLFPRDQARFREQSYDGNDSHIVIDSTKLGLRHLQSKQIQLLACILSAVLKTGRKKEERIEQRRTRTARGKTEYWKQNSKKTWLKFASGLQLLLYPVNEHK